jgi:inorganic triphosphatase YgiF
MAAKIELKISLDSRETAERLMRDEFFTRFMKDDFRSRDVKCDYYDTPDGELSKINAVLRVKNINYVNVADLKLGTRNEGGLFQGQQWLCKFGGIDRVLADLREHGAPPELEQVTAPLIITRVERFKRFAATLYMPDQVRVELSFDIYADSTEHSAIISSAATLGLELLFGAGDELMNYIEELKKEFSL